MEALLQHFRSPDFLFFGLAMGLVLNVIGSYLRDLVDKGYSSGSSLLRGISKRSRAKRAARAQEISEWIESHENGAVLALIEANHSVVMGYLLIVASMIGCVAALMRQVDAEPILKQLPLALLVGLPGVLGISTASIGGQIRRVVSKHPKGLAGLHRDK
jgi:hypothetical protein